MELNWMRDHLSRARRPQRWMEKWLLAGFLYAVTAFEVVMAVGAAGSATPVVIGVSALGAMAFPLGARWLPRRAVLWTCLTGIGVSSVVCVLAALLTRGPASGFAQSVAAVGTIVALVPPRLLAGHDRPVALVGPFFAVVSMGGTAILGGALNVVLGALFHGWQADMLAGLCDVAGLATLWLVPLAPARQPPA